MNPEAALDLARRGKLYPSTILHGGSPDERRAMARELARSVLCEQSEAERPCGRCRHCRRIDVDPEAEPFHPDFRVLWRDLKTSTSVDATRRFLQLCQQTPFEAAAQAFVIAEAESLSNEAANALLKVLEEPPTGAPRHFFLLAPSRQDLLPTLRSRSWEVFLGGGLQLDEESIQELVESLQSVLEQSAAILVPMRLAAVLEAAGDFKEVRAETPWVLAAAAVTRLSVGLEDRRLRRRLLALAADLLDAPRWRLRAIAPQRLLEGLAVRHLQGPYRVEPLALRG